MVQVRQACHSPLLHVLNLLEANEVTRAWNGLRLTSPTHLAQCILHAITGLVAARTHQIRLSGGGVVPDVESYVQWRREAGVAEMAFALIPYAYGLDFDPELEMEIELREMTGLAGDLISWSTVSSSYILSGYL